MTPGLLQGSGQVECSSITLYKVWNFSNPKIYIYISDQWFQFHFHSLDGHVPFCCILQIKYLQSSASGKQKSVKRLVTSRVKAPIVPEQQAKTYIKRGRGRKIKHTVIRTRGLWMAGQEARQALLFSPIKKAESPDKSGAFLHTLLSEKRLISCSGGIISEMLQRSLRRGASRKQTLLNSRRPASPSL